jgi:hypothetical protein
MSRIDELNPSYLEGVVQDEPDKPDTEHRTWGQTAEDIGIKVAEPVLGAVRTVTGGARALEADPNGVLADIDRWVGRQQKAIQQEGLSAKQKALDESKWFNIGPDDRSAWDHPFEVLGSQALGLVAPVAATVATGGGALPGLAIGALNSGSAVNQIRDDIDQAPLDDLKKLQPFMDIYRNNGGDERDAREQLFKKSVDIISLATNAGANMLTFGALGGALERGVVDRGLKAFLGRSLFGGTEGAALGAGQGASGELVRQKAAIAQGRQSDLDIRALVGAAEEAVPGMAAPLTALHGFRAPPKVRDTSPAPTGGGAPTEPGETTVAEYDPQFPGVPLTSRAAAQRQAQGYADLAGGKTGLDSDVTGVLSGQINPPTAMDTGAPPTLSGPSPTPGPRPPGVWGQAQPSVWGNVPRELPPPPAPPSGAPPVGGGIWRGARPEVQARLSPEFGPPGPPYGPPEPPYGPAEHYGPPAPRPPQPPPEPYGPFAPSEPRRPGEAPGAGPYRGPPTAPGAPTFPDVERPGLPTPGEFGGEEARQPQVHANTIHVTPQDAQKIRAGVQLTPGPGNSYTVQTRRGQSLGNINALGQAEGLVPIGFANDGTVTGKGRRYVARPATFAPELQLGAAPGAGPVRVGPWPRPRAPAAPAAAPAAAAPTAAAVAALHAAPLRPGRATWHSNVGDHEVEILPDPEGQGHAQQQRGHYKVRYSITDATGRTHTGDAWVRTDELSQRGISPGAGGGGGGGPPEAGGGRPTRGTFQEQLRAAAAAIFEPTNERLSEATEKTIRGGVATVDPPELRRAWADHLQEAFDRRKRLTEQDFPQAMRRYMDDYEWRTMVDAAMRENPQEVIDTVREPPLGGGRNPVLQELDARLEGRRARAGETRQRVTRAAPQLLTNLPGTEALARLKPREAPARAPAEERAAPQPAQQRFSAEEARRNIRRQEQERLRTVAPRDEREAAAAQRPLNIDEQDLLADIERHNTRVEEASPHEVRPGPATWHSNAGHIDVEVLGDAPRNGEHKIRYAVTDREGTEHRGEAWVKSDQLHPLEIRPDERARMERVHAALTDPVSGRIARADALRHREGLSALPFKVHDMPPEITAEPDLQRFNQLVRELRGFRPEDMAKKPVDDVFRQLLRINEDRVNQRKRQLPIPLEYYDAFTALHGIPAHGISGPPPEQRELRTAQAVAALPPPRVVPKAPARLVEGEQGVRMEPSFARQIWNKLTQSPEGRVYQKKLMDMDRRRATTEAKRGLMPERREIGYGEYWSSVFRSYWNKLAKGPREKLLLQASQAEGRRLTPQELREQVIKEVEELHAAARARAAKGEAPRDIKTAKIPGMRQKPLPPELPTEAEALERMEEVQKRQASQRARARAGAKQYGEREKVIDTAFKDAIKKRFGSEQRFTALIDNLFTLSSVKRPLTGHREVEGEPKLARYFMPNWEGLPKDVLNKLSSKADQRLAKKTGRLVLRVGDLNDYAVVKEAQLAEGRRLQTFLDHVLGKITDDMDKFRRANNYSGGTVTWHLPYARAKEKGVKGQMGQEAAKSLAIRPTYHAGSADQRFGAYSFTADLLNMKSALDYAMLGLNKEAKVTTIGKDGQLKTVTLKIPEAATRTSQRSIARPDIIGRKKGGVPAILPPGETGRASTREEEIHRYMAAVNREMPDFAYKAMKAMKGDWEAIKNLRTGEHEQVMRQFMGESVQAREAAGIQLAEPEEGEVTVGYGTGELTAEERLAEKAARERAEASTLAERKPAYVHEEQAIPGKDIGRGKGYEDIEEQALALTQMKIRVGLARDWRALRDADRTNLSFEEYERQHYADMEAKLKKDFPVGQRVRPPERVGGPSAFEYDPDKPTVRGVAPSSRVQWLQLERPARSSLSRPARIEVAVNPDMAALHNIIDESQHHEVTVIRDVATGTTWATTRDNVIHYDLVRALGLNRKMGELEYRVFGLDKGRLIETDAPRFGSGGIDPDLQHVSADLRERARLMTTRELNRWLEQPHGIGGFDEAGLPADHRTSYGSDDVEADGETPTPEAAARMAKDAMSDEAHEELFLPGTPSHPLISKPETTTAALDRLKGMIRNGTAGDLPRRYISDDFIDQLARITHGTEVYHAPYDATAGQAAMHGGSWAHYLPFYDRVVLSHDVAPDLYARSVLHETVHAATEGRLNADPVFAKEVNDLVAEATAHAERQGISLRQRDLYGLTNPHEYLTESVSNQRFRDFLASVGTDKPGISGPKTLLQATFRAIRNTFARVMGFFHANTALDVLYYDTSSVLGRTDALIKRSMAEIERQGRERRLPTLPAEQARHADGRYFARGVGPREFIKDMAGATQVWGKDVADRATYAWETRNKNRARGLDFMTPYDQTKIGRQDFRAHMEKAFDTIEKIFAEGNRLRDADKRELAGAAKIFYRWSKGNRQRAAEAMIDESNHGYFADRELTGKGNEHFSDTLANAQAKAEHPAQQAEYRYLVEHLPGYDKFRDVIHKFSERREEEMRKERIRDLVRYGNLMPENLDPVTRERVSEAVRRWIDTKPERLPPDESKGKTAERFENMREILERVPEKALIKQHLDVDNPDVLARIKEIRATPQMSRIPGPYVPFTRQGKFAVSGNLVIPKPANALLLEGDINHATGEPAGNDRYVFKTEAEARAFERTVTKELGVKQLKEGSGPIDIDVGTGQRALTPEVENLRTDDPERFRLARGKALQDLKDAGANIEQHYAVQFQKKLLYYAPTEYDAKKITDDLRSQYGNRINVTEPKDVFARDGRQNEQFVGTALQKQIDSLRQSGAFKRLDTHEQAAVIDRLTSSAAAQVMNRGLKQRYLPRGYVKGASTNILGAMDEYSAYSGRYLAKLKNQAELQQRTEAVKNWLKNNEHLKDVLAEQRVYNAMMHRLHSPTENPRDNFVNRAVDRALKWTMLDKLPGVGYFLANATDAISVGLPLMAGRHGMIRALSMMGTMYNLSRKLRAVGSGLHDLVEAIRAGTDMTDYEKQIMGAVKDEVDGKRLGALYQHAFERAMFDRSANLEYQNTYMLNKSVLDKVGDYGTGIFQGINTAIEAVNRFVTLGTAYRLEFSRLTKKGMSEEAAHEAAVQYAMNIGHEANGIYANFNTPEYFNKGPLAKMIFQFKKYPQRIAMNYIRAASGAIGLLKGERTEENIERAKQLGYMLATQGVLAGTLGMPTEIFSIPLNALYLAGLSKYNWDDVQVGFRQWADKEFGHEGGMVVSHGALRWLTGTAIDQRLGQDSMLTFGSPASRKASDVKASVFNFLAGATGSSAFQKFTGIQQLGAAIGAYVDGADDVAMKHMGEASRNLMPFRFVTDILQAANKGTPEGMQTYAGRQMRQPYTTGEQIMRGIGLQPAREAESGEMRREVQQTRQGILDQKKTFTDEFVQSPPGMQRERVWQQIQAWNRANPDLPPLTRADLLKASTARAKAEAAPPSQLGLPSDKYTIPLTKRAAHYVTGE